MLSNIIVVIGWYCGDGHKSSGGPSTSVNNWLVGNHGDPVSQNYIVIIL